MRLLLDTHAFLWWLDGDRRLSRRARTSIGSPGNEVLLSAVSAWEITTKFRLGKLPGAAAVAADVLGCMGAQGFKPLDISIRHAQRAGGMTAIHQDPFDRMLIAQAQIEDLALVSNETLFDDHNVRRLW